MKIVVQYSGGKDSQASLIWTVKKYGASNITAVFCDTGWEHESTYKHIEETCQVLGVDLVTLKSKRYDGMLDMAVKKGRFPSSGARFCTEELKVKPFVDWLLEQEEHFLIIQGIRKNESVSRSNMNQECRLFKYYFEPYKYDKNGRAKHHTYRSKEVKKWCEKYDDSVIRPVFEWTGQEVINYILDAGMKPNPLYGLGATRVGCFPCIMTSKSELKRMIELTPEFIEKVNQAEIQTQTSFFPPDYIPKRFCSQIDKKGVRYPVVQDVVNYLTETSLNMFEDDELYNQSCMSFYAGICE